MELGGVGRLLGRRNLMSFFVTSTRVSYIDFCIQTQPLHCKVSLLVTNTREYQIYTRMIYRGRRSETASQPVVGRQL